MPGAKHACPTVAACWSPATPPMGMACPRTSTDVVPKSAALSRTSGSTLRGTSKSASRASSHACAWMSKSRVREALVASVACTAPPVRRQIRNVSMVPNARSPAAARSRAPSTWSRIHASLVAEKYGSRSSPVFAPTAGSCPASRSVRQRAAVRRSCHTMARWIGAPLARSQTTVVSRWFVMPIAATAPPAAASASRVTARVEDQISSGSCSTQPPAG